ncbi:hypothetical protein IWW55_004458 [Coemansia sp. RSA 2706]|nr:hypothetical protein IWW55_004458 [Coemansia sp. RSA 2706]KAJ2392092.1 hypothetical protein H4S02_000979 [Coemansia sp. RSA 2611]
MKCPSLTVLTIQHAVNATALIEIITRHPNLESATIENLETNRLPPGIVAPDSDDGCRCAPLHNKLSKLSLSDHYIDRSRKIYLTLVMYFALRLPSLRELTIGGALHGAWDEFVWSHSVSYPHLEAIELKI